jgi:formylglycine-generating enzyme required for sulfatase activity
MCILAVTRSCPAALRRTLIAADMRYVVAIVWLTCASCAESSPPPPVGPVVPRVTAAAPASAVPIVAAVASAPAPPPSSDPPAAPPPQCSDGEVFVPPTSAEGFVMSKGIKGEHRVVLTRGFCMDANEVSVAAYAPCIEAGACTEPWRGDPYSTYPAKTDYPVNMVSWTKARAFCAWAGKRLPTEAEWEWAATGPDQTKYPWGDEPEPSCEYVDFTKYGAPKWAAGADVGCGGGGPSPVASHPKGDKVWPGGAIHDLAGNVWEWMEDTYAPFGADAQTDPLIAARASVHVIRGGGWNRSYAGMEVTYRGAAATTYQVPALGFRCVRPVSAAPIPHP